MFFIRTAVGFKGVTVGVTMAFSKGFDVFGKLVADVAGVCPIVHYPFLKAFKICVVVDDFRHVVFNKINNIFNFRNVCNSFLAFFPDDNVSVTIIDI